MINYHYFRCTHRAVRKFKHIERLGRITQIIGKRYIAFIEHKYPVIRECVIVKGTNGKCRFNDLLWGYKGEGPRGLVVLLVKIGLKQEDAEQIAFNTPRLQSVGIDWTIDFPLIYKFVLRKE